MLTEVPPGNQPTARHFLFRNQIIASLVLGVVVVEAASRSGSLITRREASRLSGRVMAIPGSPLDPRSEWCNTLIRDGTTLLQNSADIIERLSCPIKAGVPVSAVWDASAMPLGSEVQIADCRKIILEGLGIEPTDIDDLVRWCAAPTA